MYANAAVNCLDLPPAFTAPGRRRAAPSPPSRRPPRLRQGPRLGLAELRVLARPQPPATPHRIEAKGAAPILVVGTTRDPATPYTWAQSLASQLSSGHLLTYDGDGHTAYGRGCDCIDTAVNPTSWTARPPAEQQVA